MDQLQQKEKVKQKMNTAFWCHDQQINDKNIYTFSFYWDFKVECFSLCL